MDTNTQPTPPAATTSPKHSSWESFLTDFAKVLETVAPFEAVLPGKLARYAQVITGAVIEIVDPTYVLPAAN